MPWPTLRIPDYFSHPLILSRPALALASSRSPPGAPPTPIAPIASASTLISNRARQQKYVRQLRQTASGWCGTYALRDRATGIFVALLPQHELV